MLILNIKVILVSHVYATISGENTNEIEELDVCLSVHRCICVEKKNQLDATEWFIALIICSTRFGHFFAHHQDLETICVLLPSMVCDVIRAKRYN